MARAYRGRVPSLYIYFFLWLEPLSTIVGASYAYFYPAVYLQLTSPTSSIASPDLATVTALAQLANLYVLFAVNEAFVLRATSDLRVWRTLLFGLLLADFGHLWSVRNLDRGGNSWGGIYTDFRSWNEMDWGNIAFVYAGATMRLAFLAGIGL